MNKIILSSFLLLTPFLGTHAERILLETEAFSDHGGWKLDTGFLFLSNAVDAVTILPMLCASCC